jgi:hypothetical protein
MHEEVRAPSAERIELSARGPCDPSESTSALTQTWDEAQLATFLVTAKRATYAARGDEASVPPRLNGSRQLEFSEGPWFYRDVYFGTGFFVGQEVVEFEHRPVWSMSYAGGAKALASTAVEIRALYKFLREALRRVDEATPFRGPPIYRSEALVYRCDVSGTVARFRGSETIMDGDRKAYGLTFSGGLLR